MLTMTPSDVRLGATINTKEEAIRTAAGLLLESDSIDPEYVDSMLARELTATTYLGNGVSIPHGRPQDAKHIKNTRVSILQIPQGVTWQDGQKAHLVFGIAAKSDEHIGLLRRLTGIVSDSALAERLANTNDPAEIIAAISENADAPSNAPAVSSDFHGSEIELAFSNPRGFHLRPAGKFARAVQAYDGKVTLVAKSREIEADSPSRILSLGIAAGDSVSIRVEGDNETDTLSNLAALLEEINNEPQEDEDFAANAGNQWTGELESTQTISGTMAAPGLAIATAWKWNPVNLADRKRAVGDTAAETAALKSAITVAKKQLLALTEGDLNAVQRDLFEAHASLVSDEKLLEQAVGFIDAGDDALTAWTTTIQIQTAKLANLEDKRLAQRADDLRDVGQRVQKILLGIEVDPISEISEPVILVAKDLDPSQAAQLKADKIKGICLKNGSPNAHAAIVARSLGIPMLVAAGSSIDRLPIGETVILDASGGRIILSPSEADLESAQAAIQEVSIQRNQDWEQRFEPAILQDGHRVEVVANIGQTAEAASVIDSGAEGVGLLRTEFLFLDRDHAPDEEEQYKALRTMIEGLQGLPMIVRTLDIGGDKPVSYLGLSEQDLSFLGLRGFRLSLARPDLAITQLRAIFRAAEHGPIRLMFPMIATPNDFLRARELAEKVRREVGGQKVELGVMIEVPSAVTMAPELAELADFFSIGTNDLTQYALAVDRTHPLLARRADSLHPVVLRLIRDTVKAAHDKGKWVGVCGGLAADPLGALILTGLGIDELSMPPSIVPQVKALLRQEKFQTLSDLAEKALHQRDARAVRALRPSH
ncbi:phosphoenolpyruvate--protein phosphotransferase [Pelagicoccus sp. SDUM812002]|uniref:phosphoenolpyruvate--protein phosphotransferase n=1 Tax=Pelagicoccus sp. SDUM812002 TaxID=3041266 RepID=UPI00280D9A1E|nr:phosphoenolpyruvate--protein phosphotransferase [Pelagicoccus sp. SDUM812002]MDQ8188442.1 phosphoenolpyruvate--protein phosphotransferase [Pelagicoccus sp. SDUM812002]